MSNLPPDSYMAFVAWPYQAAEVAEVAALTLRTLERVASATPVPFAWYVTGEREPLLLDLPTLERYVASEVWRSDPDEDGSTYTDPNRGYSLAFTGWRTDAPKGTWKSAITLRLSVGNTGTRPDGTQVTTSALLWPNSAHAEISGHVPDAVGRTFAAHVLHSLITDWPASWGAYRSDVFLDSLPRTRNPATLVGYSTWIAAHHATVPAVVPHASQTPVKDGVWLELDVPADAEPDPALIADFDATLRAAGSLPPIPAIQSPI